MSSLLSSPYVRGGMLFPQNLPNSELLTKKDTAKVIRKYNKERGDEHFDWVIHLPSTIIDGISVRIDFVGNHEGMSLVIWAHNLWFYKKKRLITMETVYTCKPILFKKTYIQKPTKYTLQNYIQVLQLIHKDIQVMKFDKLEGLFYTSDHNISITLPRNEDDKWDFLLCHQLQPEDCCVCLDTTKTTTPCGHKLCISCWNSIKVYQNKLPCPICRTNLRQREALAYLFPKGFIGIDDYEQDNNDNNDISNVFANDHDDDASIEFNDIGFDEDDAFYNIDDDDEYDENMFMRELVRAQDNY
jgi:hypothetical protein